MSRQTRQRITHEAARIMMDDGVTNIAVAKKKAMQRLGVQDKHQMPDNIEVESALCDYQQLFQPDQHISLLNKYRKTALNAMTMLKPFSPRLAGPVLRGTATKYNTVSIHVFTDTPEEIHFHLMDRRIPFEIDESQYQLSKKQIVVCPVCRFFAGEVEITLSIFPNNGLHQPPLSSIDEKPMKRVDIESVKTLISG